MRKLHVAAACALLLATSGFSSSLSAAGLIDPFGRDGVNLDPQEWTMIKGAVGEVLQAPKVGGTASWDNPPTGRAGQAKVLRIYQAKGLNCVEVEHDFTKGAGNRYVLPFCQVADGSWKVAF
ncbi:MAG TPA: hypothetical protein VGO34_15145 [Alphaproteobacteria bacterium]|jgi:surface antigen